MTRLRAAILISGRGTNMSAILEASQQSDYPIEPVLILSNRLDAEGLTIAEAAGVRAIGIDHKPFGRDREAFERELQTELENRKTDLVILAGFMRILTPWFVRQWFGRMINIHPSLLPKYPGLNTHQRAIDAGDTEGGCSVHWVTETVDEGAVIAQSAVPIRAGDTPDTLASRVLVAEHDLYPKAVKLAALEIVSRSQAST